MQHSRAQRLRSALSTGWCAIRTGANSEATRRDDRGFRLLNFVQSALLLGLMAAIAWIAVTAIVGPETGLLMALAMVGDLLFPPALPHRLLLSA